MIIRVAMSLNEYASNGYHFVTLTESEWSWAKNDPDYVVLGQVEVDEKAGMEKLAPQVDEVVQRLEQKATADYAAAMSKIADFKARLLCLESPEGVRG